MNEQLPHTIDADTPVEIHGYKTDPLRRGYQVLWNYENIYWRALVGNDAWSLYEVLRSFCHEHSKTCYPSVNLLMAILGIKQRRVLTGWTTEVKGKLYQYPGLIEVLQTHGLTVAEVRGEGPQMRYTFHVNLTPGLLTQQQLVTLPEILQTKHIELLARCAQAQQALEAKKRPAKAQTQRNDKGKGGSDKLSHPYDKLSGGSDKLSHKHYPKNTTQETTTEPTQPDATPPHLTDVVVALKEFGVGGTIATKLVHTYPPEQIREKIDYLTFLQETNPTKVSNPRGWLRKAIEEDYGPPDRYKSRAQRRQEAEAKQAQQVQIDSAIDEQERAWSPQDWRTWVVQKHHVSEEQQHTTNQLLAFYQKKIKPSVFLAWLSNTMLIALDEREGRIAVPSDHAHAWLSQELTPPFDEALFQLLKRRVQVTFEVIAQTPRRFSPAGRRR